MVFGILAKRLGKFAADNSPAILTAMGVTGALATAYLTGVATVKAVEIIAEEERHETLPDPDGGEDIPVKYAELTFKDKVELTWKVYVPPAATAAMTIIAIVGANRIQARRAAALATAFSISEKVLEEYKKKVTSKLGEKKAQAITDEIAIEQMNEARAKKKQIIVTGLGDHLCFDRYTRTYFTGDIHKIKTAGLDMAYKILHEGYASLSDWWDMLEFPHTQDSDNLGWNSDKKFELELTYDRDEHDRPCVAIGFSSMPFYRFYQNAY